VFVSTVVTGEANGRELDEGTELPVETAYGRSKQEGERLVRESGLHNAVVRPSHVYGPGGWYEEEFVKRLRQPGRFAVIGSGENMWDVVRVEDVASACVDAAERAAAHPGVGRAPGGRGRSGQGGRPLGAQLERAHQERARLGPALPDRARRRAGRGGQARRLNAIPRRSALSPSRTASRHVRRRHYGVGP